MTHNFQEVGKYLVDATAGIVTVGSLLSFLPPLAAAFTIFWTGIRIYEYFKNRNK